VGKLRQKEKEDLSHLTEQNMDQDEILKLTGRTMNRETQF
jgi:hypothetical protein